MNSSKYPSHRPTGREHIPNYPKGFIALRFVQLILAVVVLGLCAYSLIGYRAAGIALSLFTVSSLATAGVTLSTSDMIVNQAVATLIITVYSIIAKFGPAVTCKWKIFNTLAPHMCCRFGHVICANY